MIRRNPGISAGVYQLCVLPVGSQVVHYEGLVIGTNMMCVLAKQGGREMDRPTWDRYFSNIAKEVATRATCPRASVGVVVVKDHRILSTGYNGAPSGEPHCLDVGCLILTVNGHCERTIHAETNAVVQAARFGMSVNGATLYYWDSRGRPANSCIKCFQVMKAAGIRRIVSKDGEEVILEVIP